MALKFTEEINRKRKDDYRNFDYFPECSGAVNKKVRWQETDPKHGQDFTVWYQNKTLVNTIEECDELKGIFNTTASGATVCYSYWVLEQVCLSIA